MVNGITTTSNALALALLQGAPPTSVAQEAAGTWQEGPSRWLHLLGDTGPWVLLLLVTLLVLRAAARQGRYRALAVLGPARQQHLRAVLKECEAATSGEIVPVVVERSDPHPTAAWRAAVAGAAVGSVLLMRQLPWDAPALLLLGQAALGALGFLLARLLPDLERMFLFETRASAVAGEQALQEFHAQGLQRTAGATGVLLFVSLFEHRVIVLADEGIASRVPPETWADVDDLVLDGVVAGDLAGGLEAALRRTGALLAEQFPAGDKNPNELPDRLVVRRQ